MCKCPFSIYKRDLLHGRVHVFTLHVFTCRMFMPCFMVVFTCTVEGILKHYFHDCRRRCFGPGGIVHLLPQPLPLTNTPHTASSSSPQIRTATTAGAASKSNARGAAGSGGGGGTAEAGSIRVVLKVLWTLVSYLSLAAECLQLIERESVVYWYSFSNPRTRCITTSDECRGY